MSPMLGFSAGIPLDDKRVEKLFDEHFAPLARAVRLLVDEVEEAEDIVQEAFARLLTSRRRLRNIDDAPAYLRSTAFNLARSRLRKRGTVRRSEALITATTNALHDETSRRLSPESTYLEHESSERVTEALRTLTDRQRECVVMRYFLSLSEREIAEALNISTGSVKTHTSRAMEALNQALAGSDEQ
jgi:RNA polymerase sigma factor (sigma-70 family)